MPHRSGAGGSTLETVSQDSIVFLLTARNESYILLYFSICDMFISNDLVFLAYLFSTRRSALFYVVCLRILKFKGQFMKITSHIDYNDFQIPDFPKSGILISVESTKITPENL